MNKSTPISQLPNANNNPQFINEQQRQYIAQAQQAISNSHMPQNTQSSSDIANDDDIVVQDILNQIDAASRSDQSQEKIPQETMSNPLLIQPNFQHPMMVPPPQFMYQMNNGGFPFQPENQPSGPMDIKTFYMHFADDLKLAAVVFLVTIVVHFIPFDKFIGKYIALDKVPYHNIILNAIMIALLVIIVKKFTKI